MPLPLAAVVWAGTRWVAKKGIKKAAKRIAQRTKKTPKPSSKATQKPLRSRTTSRATPKGKRKESIYTRTKGLSSEYGKRGGLTKSMSKTVAKSKPQKRYKEKKMVQEWTSEYKPLKGNALVRHLNRKHKKPTKYGTRTHSTTIRRGKGPTSEPGGLKVFEKNFRALKKGGYKYY